MPASSANRLTGVALTGSTRDSQTRAISIRRVGGKLPFAKDLGGRSGSHGSPGIQLNNSHPSQWWPQRRDTVCAGTLPLFCATAVTI
jgi:hypothetical protein